MAAPSSTTKRLVTTVIWGTLFSGVGGCGGNAPPYGPSVRVSGDFNGWARERGPSLDWDGTQYQGNVLLPAGTVQLQLITSLAGQQVIGGRPDYLAPVPSTVLATPTDLSSAMSGMEPPAEGGAKKVIRVEFPVAARYRFAYEPVARHLRIDFAADAESDSLATSTVVPRLIEALRGSDRVDAAAQAQRAADMRGFMVAPTGETPVVSGPEKKGLTFLYLAPEPPQRTPAEVNLIGEINDWGRQSTAPKTMVQVLGGRVAYKGYQAQSAFFAYRVEVDGRSQVDPLNRWVISDGVTLPPNLSNVLGGNLGEFNSVASAAGSAAAMRARLHRHFIAGRNADVPGREVFVYQPEGYADNPNADRTLPVLYVLDGKDALVRGYYDAQFTRLIKDKQVPEFLAVFVPARAEVQERLAEYSRYPDNALPEVLQRADAFLDYFFEAVVKQVEERYALTPRHRAVLGVELSGALATYLTWNAPEGRPLQRVGSQSGRFNFGENGGENKYVKMIQANSSRKGVVSKVCLDTFTQDPPAVRDSNMKIKAALVDYPVELATTAAPATVSSSPWEGLSARVPVLLNCLLK